MRLKICLKYIVFMWKGSLRKRRRIKTKRHKWHLVHKDIKISIRHNPVQIILQLNNSLLCTTHHWISGPLFNSRELMIKVLTLKASLKKGEIEGAVLIIRILLILWLPNNPFKILNKLLKEVPFLVRKIRLNIIKNSLCS